MLGTIDLPLETGWDGRVAIDGRDGRAFFLSPPPEFLNPHQPLASDADRQWRLVPVDPVAITAGTPTLLPIRFQPTALAIDPLTGHVLVAAIHFLVADTVFGSEAELLTVDPSAGTVLHTLMLDSNPTDPTVDTPLSVDVDAVTNHTLLRTMGDTVYTVDLASNRVVGSTVVGQGLSDQPMSASVGQYVFFGTLGTQDKSLRWGVAAVNAGTGQLEHLVGTDIPQTVLADETHHLVVTGELGGSVAVLDGETQAVVHQVPTGGYLTAAAVDSENGHILAVSGIEGARVTLIDDRTGKVLHHTGSVLDRPVSVAVDSLTHHGYVTDEGSDRLVVIDTVSGKIVGTMSGKDHSIQDVGSVVVDEHSHRALVLTDAGLLILDTQEVPGA